MEIKKYRKSEIPYDIMRKSKEYGFSDSHIAKLTEKSEEEIRNLRKRYGIEVDYKLVDTCAGEFEAETPYYYSTYEQ